MLLDTLTCTGQVHPAKDDPAPNVNCAEVEPALEPPPDSFLPTLTGITVRTKTGSFKSEATTESKQKELRAADRRGQMPNTLRSQDQQDGTGNWMWGVRKRRGVMMTLRFRS